MFKPSFVVLVLVFAATPCFSQNAAETKLNFQKTKEVENRIKTAFLESNEVVFKIKIHGTQKWEAVKISDKDVLREFSHHFRFNESLAVERFNNSLVTPSLAISVDVTFSSEENFGFVSSLPNMHQIIVTTREKNSDISVWYNANLSLETVLVFNYYFQEALKTYKKEPHFFLPLADYMEDYYSWSFVEDLKKKFNPYTEAKEKP